MSRSGLGHQTMQMTMRYAHLSPGDLGNEVRLLDELGSTKRVTKGQRAKTRARGTAKVCQSKEFAPCRTRTCDLLVRRRNKKR